MTATHIALLVAIYFFIAVGTWTAFVETCRFVGRHRRRRVHPPVPTGFVYGRGHSVTIVKEPTKGAK